MRKEIPTDLDPELVIGKEAAIDRLGYILDLSIKQARPNFTKQVKVVRDEARRLCSAYRNCRVEDWCWQCSSGQDGQPLYRGGVCLSCKLLTTEVLFASKDETDADTKT